MITETREVYKCEYCAKMYQIKRFAERHEDLCKKNPDNNRPCFGCKFLSKKDAFVYSDHPYGGEQKHAFSLLFCSAKNIFLHPPQIEKKGTKIELEEDKNEPMPKTCNQYETVSFLD